MTKEPEPEPAEPVATEPETTIEPAAPATTPAAAPAPAADAEPEAGEPTAAVVPAAASTSTSASERGLRKTRAAATVVGVVGLVVCAVLAIGILVVHGWVSDAVGGVFDTADRQIERGSTIVELATARVQERVTDIDSFIADASAMGAGIDIPPELAARAAIFADRYDAVRNQFSELRARVESGLETVRQVARLVPFVDLPELPTDELASLDARLQRFDDSLATLRQGVVSSIVAERAVEGATNLRSTISEVVDFGGRIQTRLEEAQDRLDLANSRLDGFLWLVTIVLLLLVAYIAILNGLVIWLSRR